MTRWSHCSQMGIRGGRAMIEMVAAKMAALQVNSRAQDPLGWAKAQRTPHRAVALIGFPRAQENQFQRLARVNALLELLL